MLGIAIYYKLTVYKVPSLNIVNLDSDILFRNRLEFHSGILQSPIVAIELSLCVNKDVVSNYFMT